MIGHRKLLLAGFLGVLGIVAYLLLKTINSDFVHLLVGLYSAFAAGNACEHASSAYRSSKQNSSPPTTESHEKLHADLRTVQEHLATLGEGVTLGNNLVQYLVNRVNGNAPQQRG